MRAAVDIAVKDLRQRLRDRSALLLGIVAPFTLAALFSLILGGLDEEFHARWAIVDLDDSEVSAGFEAGPIAGMVEAGVVSTERLPSAEAARAAVAEGRVEAAIVIPDGFGDAVGSMGQSTIELIVDPDAVISGQVARSVVAGYTDRIEAIQLSVASALAASGTIPDAATIEQLAEEAQALADPILLSDAAASDRTASTSTYYAAAMAIMFVFLTAQFGVVSLHAEKRMGTLARIVASPVRPSSVLAGKIAVSMTLAIVSMAVITIGTALLLGASWGDPLAVAVLILGAAIAATGIALLAVGLTRTEDQAGAGVAIMTISLAILGGAFFPTSQASELMAQASLLTPHAWFLRGVDDVASGGGLAATTGPIVVLVVFGILTGAVGALRARRVIVS